MKRFAVVVFLYFALAVSAGAQNIKKSPLEGCWTAANPEDAEYSELVFFGNVIMAGEENAYMGFNFTYTNRILKFAPDPDISWTYSLSGDILSITDEDGEHFSFTRTKTPVSPLEGIWKISGGTGFEEGKETYMMFIGNIMAAMIDGECEGIKVLYERGYLLEYDDTGESGASDWTEEELAEEGLKFTVSGKTLTLTFGPEDTADMNLTKVY